MVRIRYVTLEEATPEVRARMEKEIAEQGEVTPGTGVWGHAPTIMDGNQALNAAIGAAGRISPELRGLVNVRVATIIGCPF
jgi:alkylhydroperoxidase family enzyme